MIWLRGPYESLSDKARENLAKLAAGGDLAQEAINREALKGVGAVLTVLPRRAEDDAEKVPPFVVINLVTGNYMTFMGLGVEGGDTREEAFERADRIGYKNDMGVVDLDAEDAYQLCLNCGLIAHRDLEWSYWQETEDGEGYRPNEPGETDPLHKCPNCGEMHGDCYRGAGIFDGTREECGEERQRLVKEEGQQDEWLRALGEARKEEAT